VPVFKTPLHHRDPVLARVRTEPSAQSDGSEPVSGHDSGAACWAGATILCSFPGVPLLGVPASCTAHGWLLCCVVWLVAVQWSKTFK